MKSSAAGLALALFASSPSAFAAVAPECQVAVLRPITDDLGNPWPAGKTLPVDIERSGANGGAYCASGGSCLPRQVGGAPAVRLVNCKIGAAIGGGDYRLTLDPAVVPAASVRAGRLRDDVDRRLSDLGFSDASAGGLADTYASHPQSAQGRLVAKALAGSPTALATLKRHDP